jgi:hypothetical protein
MLLLSWLFFFLICKLFFSPYRNYARDYYDFEPELSRREEELPHGLMRRDAVLYRREPGWRTAAAVAGGVGVALVAKHYYKKYKANQSQNQDQNDQ